MLDRWKFQRRADILSEQWGKNGDPICCPRCGYERPTHIDDISSSVHLWWARHMFPTFELCGGCTAYVLRWKAPLEDAADLIVCSNYIQRAISCRRTYLKTQVKSKQQDSLERCLSTRLKECLTET